MVFGRGAWDRKLCGFLSTFHVFFMPTFFGWDSEAKGSTRRRGWRDVGHMGSGALEGALVLWDMVALLSEAVNIYVCVMYCVFWSYKIVYNSLSSIT